MYIIGIDPGLQTTGWGIISANGNHLSHIDNGIVVSNKNDDIAIRLQQIFIGITTILKSYQLHSAAIEETFVNVNPASTLKLGYVRGVVLLAPALLGLPVFNYAPNKIKKSVVGVGHADKQQIHHMVKILLPTANIKGPDSADALAIAICHAHHAMILSTQQKL